MMDTIWKKAQRTAASYEGRKASDEHTPPCRQRNMETVENTGPHHGGFTQTEEMHEGWRGKGGWWASCHGDEMRMDLIRRVAECLKLELAKTPTNANKERTPTQTTRRGGRRSDLSRIHIIIS